MVGRGKFEAKSEAMTFFTIEIFQKDWDTLTNDSENKISMINADNERLKEKLGGAVERGDQLEIQLITEKVKILSRL